MTGWTPAYACQPELQLCLSWANHQQVLALAFARWKVHCMDAQERRRLLTSAWKTANRALLLPVAAIGVGSVVALVALCWPLMDSAAAPAFPVVIICVVAAALAAKGLRRPARDGCDVRVSAVMLDLVKNRTRRGRSTLEIRDGSWVFVVEANGAEENLPLDELDLVVAERALGGCYLGAFQDDEMRVAAFVNVPVSRMRTLLEGRAAH
jgi:hypothetical protein